MKKQPACGNHLLFFFLSKLLDDERCFFLESGEGVDLQGLQGLLASGIRLSSKAISSVCLDMVSPLKTKKQQQRTQVPGNT